jgi:hypothetical protein
MNKLSSITCILVIFASSTVFGQADVVVVRSNSRIVDVREGERMIRGGWTMDPSIPLDIYVPRRSAGQVTITFVTDVESKSFELSPGGMCDFVFLLEGRESCRTRIDMREMVAQRRPGASVETATIPFKFIQGKPHLECRVNRSESMWFLFDTGAGTTVVYPSALRKGLPIEFDATGLNAGTGGTVEVKVSSDNRIEIADWYWEHESVTLVEKQADDGDGIVGINIFQDKVFEMDYDRMIMLVHDDLPAYASSYASLPMTFAGSFPMVDGTLGSGPKRSAGPFVINTGGAGALMSNRSMINQNDLRDGLKWIGKSEARGTGTGVAKLEVLLMPEFELAGHKLSDVRVVVPIADAESESFVIAIAADTPRGMLCLDVLTKFNAMFDFKNDNAYFKPNENFGKPFPSRSSGLPAIAWVALIVAGILLACFATRWVYRKLAVVR